MTVNSKTEIICIMYKQDVDKFNTFILARKESYRYIIQNSFTSTVRSTKSTKPSKLMIENIKIDERASVYILALRKYNYYWCRG